METFFLVGGRRLRQVLKRRLRLSSSSSLESFSFLVFPRRLRLR
jgi:hypothetical protein